MGSSDPRAAGQGSSSSANIVETMGYSGADLLSENEKRLCTEIRVPPQVYLSMQQVMSVEIFKGKVTKKMDAYHLFQMDPSKIDRGGEAWNCEFHCMINTARLIGGGSMEL
ncbi:transcriptional adapter ADA2b-like [Punica granatum]|uniref:Transcriptional adapter ADA2b-like n=1 Tax=Punica granatum TaxID=22663 RepID=A0A6P8DJY8_PUNGR|nr:transcriptional adapter ADA2b-like [Punica granatum]